jgi:DNA-binding helix-hairpin-helix protein with protein kinase domain
VDIYRTVDQSFAHLHAAGWSVGDVRILTAERPAWLVTGHNGDVG